MASSTNNALYIRVVTITAEYLGPAAERFVDRQIENHLHKHPHTITASDLRKLTDWLKLTFSLVTEDAGEVKDYITKLHKAAESHD